VKPSRLKWLYSSEVVQFVRLVLPEELGWSSAMSLAFCREAKELLEIYGLAVHELVCLHREQFESVIGGELDSIRFDDLIHMANERKHEAKYAYLHHLDTHGCSTLTTDMTRR